MYDYYFQKLKDLKEPIDIIVVGLGFMGFGFVSAVQKISGIRISLIISRRPQESLKKLNAGGIAARLENNPDQIAQLNKKGIIAVSDNLELIKTLPGSAVLEVTGTISYATQISLLALNSGKNLLTMNPELQVTVGVRLANLAKEKGLIFTDVIGDQPGSLSHLLFHAKMMGFEILIAGNMKRFLNRHATNGEMEKWAKDKGLSTRQTVSFTDGTKQSIEMVLVGNYFQMGILQKGMLGPKVEKIQDVLDVFPWEKIPASGVVDYGIGLSLFPGVFLVASHRDPNQQQYLRYLGLGNGPRYVLFDPYHLCHLEIPTTISKVFFSRQETINNTRRPFLQSFAHCKRPLKKGEILDGIGGDMVYGEIDTIKEIENRLPVGLSQGAVLNRDYLIDQAIEIPDIILPVNEATKLSGLV
ncbi:hypothetical protein HY345_03665 [Candidatus Microgenomates bacterium]|nr:hypothetical protein [Candidatus Microgenomates bacterium]